MDEEKECQPHESNLNHSNSELSNSNSWVFVTSEKYIENTTAPSNQFYLNCLEEPVQEISDQENGTTPSDLESDTDGISVISESDFIQDNRSDEESFTTTKLDTIQEKLENNTVSSESCEKQIVDCNHDETFDSEDISETKKSFEFRRYFTLHSVIGTSVVVVAILLAPYFSPDSSNDLDFEDVNLESGDAVHNFPSENLPKTSENEDPLSYCTNIHKNDGIFKETNIRKCLKRTFKQLRIAQKLEDRKLQIEKEVDKLECEIKLAEESDSKISSKDVIMENGEVEINYKRVYKKDKGEEYKHQKFLKKYKYDNINKDKNDKVNMYKKNKEYKYENKKSNGHYEKHWKYDSSEISNDNYKYENSHDNVVMNITLKEQQLKEKEIYLLHKEKHLNEREQNLLKRELKYKAGKENNKIREKNDRKKDKIENKNKGKRKDANILNNQNSNIKSKSGSTSRDNLPSEYISKKDGKNSESKTRRKSKLKKQNNIDKEDSELDGSSDYKIKPNLYQYEQHNEPKENNEKESHRIRNNMFKHIDISGLDKVIDDESPKKTKDKFSYKIHDFKYIKRNKTTLDNYEDNVTTNGEWYINLVNNRNIIRRKEQASSWMFDRADYRRNKRNKAYWYFQYMLNRENLRYRQRPM